jgi:hypothetical protein
MLLLLLPVFWALLLTVASPAHAAIYYVSNGGSAAAGLDTNSCPQATSISTPKLHIGGTSGGWACAQTPGDIVEVRGGTYVENLVTTAQTLVNGTAAASMVMRAHVGEA